MDVGDVLRPDCQFKGRNRIGGRFSLGNRVGKCAAIEKLAVLVVGFKPRVAADGAPKDQRHRRCAAGNLRFNGNGLLVGHGIENAATLRFQMRKKHDPPRSAAVLRRGSKSEGDRPLLPLGNRLANRSFVKSKDDLAGGIGSKR